MIEGMSAVLARIAEIKRRLDTVDPPAEPAPAFSQALTDASRMPQAGALPPAPVRYGPGSTPAGGTAALPAPPHWREEAGADTNDIRQSVLRAANRHGVDPSLALAVAQVESGFDPQSVSSAGALGVMQLMPGTARSLGVADPLDPDQNADGGVRYLREQLRRFGSVPLALAAYNAGPNRVAQHGGVPPIQETQEYVRRVLAQQHQYQDE